MEKLNKMIKEHSKFVSCYTYDREDEVITFIHTRNYFQYVVQIYNENFYRAEVFDDLTGEEMGVKYLTIENFKKLLK